MQPAPVRGPRPFAQCAAATLLLLVISVGFYWKLILTGQYTWLDAPDIANLEVPRLQFQASEWHHLRFPAWDPYQWAGQPFLGQMAGAAFPLNWPLFLFGFQNGHIRQDVLHWYYVLMHFFAALFMYWLCRDLDRSRAAAVVAGCLFSFGGYLAGSDWPTVLTGCIWAPLVFLFLLRAGRGDRPLANSGLAGALTGLAWLSGHHQAPYYTMLAGFAAYLWFALRERDWRMLRHAGVFLLFTALAGGLQLVPGLEYGRLALRWAGAPEPLGWKDAVPFSVHTEYAFTPSHLLGIVLPHMSGHVSAFAGVVGFALAVVGVAAGWRHLAVRFFAILGVASLLFAMSAHNVLYGVLYAVVPMFEKARVPARLILLFSAALAPLAAFGFDAILEAPGRVSARRLRIVLIGAGAAVFASYLALAVTGKPTADERGAGFALAALLFAALVGRALPPVQFSIATVLLVLLELGAAQQFQPSSRPDSSWRKLRQHDDIAQFLKQQPGPLRVNVDDEVIPYNFGDWHGIETSAGFLAGVTTDLFRTATHTDRVQDLLGVGYAISKEPKRPGQIAVFRGASGLTVWRNPNAFPRDWTVHEALALSGIQAVRDRLQDASIDLRRTALFPAPAPRLDPATGDETVEWLDRKASSMTLRVAMRTRGLLIVGDTWFPGWTARVDGDPASVLEVDGALRGVVLAPGDHRVELRYRPASAYVGAAMSAIGFLAALWLGLWTDR